MTVVLLFSATSMNQAFAKFVTIENLSKCDVGNSIPAESNKRDLQLFSEMIREYSAFSSELANRIQCELENLKQDYPDKGSVKSAGEWEAITSAQTVRKIVLKQAGVCQKTLAEMSSIVSKVSQLDLDNVQPRDINSSSSDISNYNFSLVTGARHIYIACGGIFNGYLPKKSDSNAKKYTCASQAITAHVKKSFEVSTQQMILEQAVFWSSLGVGAGIGVLKLSGSILATKFPAFASMLAGTVEVTGSMLMMLGAPDAIHTCNNTFQKFSSQDVSERIDAFDSLKDRSNSCKVKIVKHNFTSEAKKSKEIDLAISGVDCLINAACTYNSFFCWPHLSWDSKKDGLR